MEILQKDSKLKSCVDFLKWKRESSADDNM